MAYDCVKILTAVLLLSAATGRPAAAGPFCVVGEAIAPQCLYEDVVSCNAATASGNTYCDVNPDAKLMYYGSQPYCIVGSDRSAQCLYADRNQCNADASQSQRICIQRNQDQDTASPYRYDNRIQGYGD